MRLTASVVSLCALSVCSCAGATTLTHTTFASYIGALNGSESVEDFEGFGSDTHFRNRGVGMAGGMSMIARGKKRQPDFTGNNHVDVAPYAFTPLFAPPSAQFAHCYVDADPSGGAPQDIKILFHGLADGWRGWFGGAASGESISIDVFYRTSLLTTYNVTDNGNGIFVGFTSDRFTHLILRGTTADGSASSGQAFGMDFIGVSSVPLPTAAALATVGLALVGARRRR